MTAATPKRSLQEVLAAYDLSEGDIVLIDSGDYAGAVDVGSTDQSFEIRGTPTGSSLLRGRVTVAGASGVELRQLVLQDGVTLEDAGDFSLVANQISSSTTAISVGAASPGQILENEIHNSVVGIEAGDRQTIAHNVFFDNSQAGIQVRGKTDVRIVNNTFHAQQGDNVRVLDRASEVQLYNNILWAEGGYDIYVANDSQSGFFSDYNTLHATGSGRLVWWTRDFVDLLDWQADVARYDLHSRGTTVVNPSWSDPRFVDRAQDNFHVVELLNGLRSSSPTVDAGSPYIDQALPAAYQNLLANPSFEAGLQGWNSNPQGTAADASLRAFDGEQYYYSGVEAGGYVEQTVNLLAAGYTAAELDAQDQVAVFSARVRGEEGVDRCKTQLTLSFRDAEGNAISESSVSALVTDDRWMLTGDRVHIPTGTRHVQLRLLSSAQEGWSKNVSFDQLQLFLLPDTTVPDQGAYGNTGEDHDLVSSPHLALRWPDLYIDWERGRPQTVHWDSYGNTAESLVRIDLVQSPAGGPQTVTNLAIGAADTGEFTWTPADNGIGFGTHDLQIRISLVNDTAITDASTESFVVPEDGDIYYVNDRLDGTEEFTVAAGSNRQTGKLPTSPKPFPANLLRIYDLGPGDVLQVDAGVCPQFETVTLSASSDLGWGNDVAFEMRGPAGGTAELTTAVPDDDEQTLLRLSDADYMTVSNLTFTGGYRGIEVGDGSERFVAENLTLRDAAAEGIWAGGNWSGTAGLVDRLRGLTVYGNGAHGILVNNAGSIVIQRCQSFDNGGYGIYAGTGTTGPIHVIGDTDLSSGNGNRVYANAKGGIYAEGDVQVSGNTVFGHTNSYASAGIELTNGVAEYNVVYGNSIGMLSARSYNNHPTPRFVHNRVYGNRSSGLEIRVRSEALGNIVYSNQGAGIHISEASAELTNNLVYANEEDGILLDGYYGGSASIVNNTIFQPHGDAIHFSDNSRYGNTSQLRNNAIRVDAGYGIYVPPQAQAYLDSDYNDLWTTGSGQVGYWQGAARSRLSDWRHATFQDQNSLAQDPLWVDPDGAGNVLGAEGIDDGRDDDFHPQSRQGSFHGGGLAPVEDPVTGLPVMWDSAVTVDAHQSPLIDRGRASDDFSQEPAPNGGFINLGAYGNTAQASKSPAEYVLVTRPDGGEFWPQQQTAAVRWRSHDYTGLVKITLIRPGFSLDIATSTENDGQHFWVVPSNLETRDDYRIRVSRVGGSGISDESNQAFAIADPVLEYYVAPNGDNANSGLSADQPKASVRAILEAYDMEPATNTQSRSVIRVAPGQYNLTSNIVIGPEDSGVLITALDPQNPSVLNRDNKSDGNYVFELNGADGVTLSGLQIAGAQTGVFLGPDADSDGFELTQCEVFDNDYGLAVQESNDDARIVSNKFYDSADNSSIGIQVSGGRALVIDNDVFRNNKGIVANWQGEASGTITIESNHVHDNVTVGIEAWHDVLVRNNDLYQHTWRGEGTVGIALYDAAAEDNRVYGYAAGIAAGHFDCSSGICIRLGGSARNNTLYDNAVGIAARLGSIVEGNTSYSNDVGIHIQGIPYWNSWAPFTGTVQNNIVYANAAQGILVEHASDGARVTNNTVYQPQGDALHVQATTGDVLLSNNILTVNSGYALSIGIDSHQGLSSDYNIAHVTGTGRFGLYADRDFNSPVAWYYETGLDQHSSLADPRFVDPDGADDVLGFSAQTGDKGADDNFQVSTSSPAIDAGDPSAVYLREPWPNGNRVDVGAFGNTPQAPASQNPLLQIVSPGGVDRLEVGHSTSIRWQAAGLAQQRPVSLINAGGPSIGAWSENKYMVSGRMSGTLAGTHIDTSRVPNAPPEAAYWTFATSSGYDSDTQSNVPVEYCLPVADGQYTVRLHFAELWSTLQKGDRVFDVRINGATSLDDYDILADAGGAFIATAHAFGVTASFGEGIRIQLTQETARAYLPILSAIEVSQTDPAGFAAPTFDLAWHDGQAWQSIATDIPMDVSERGSYTWTPDQAVESAQIRVTPHDLPSGIVAVSAPFRIAPGGRDYYVRPESAGGDNRNSGKSADDPMASLAAVLRVYDLDSGDVIHVGSGYYSLLRNLVLEQQDSGVRIEGPESDKAPAVLDRGYRAPGSYLFEVDGIRNVTLDRLDITGAFTGIQIPYDAQRELLQVSRSQIYSNAFRGIDFRIPDEVLSNGAKVATAGNVNIQFNNVYDNGGDNSSGDGGGIFVSADGTLVEGNRVYGNVFRGIDARRGVVVRGNEVFDHRYDYAVGILVQQSTAIANVVHRNHTGISIGDFRYQGGSAISNTLYANDLYGLFMYSGQARDNVIYSSESGIGATGEPVIANNLIYDTTKNAVCLQEVTGRVVNNTLMPTRGNALRLEAESSGNDIRNNILYAGADGFAISVAADSQYGLTSDYNLFQLPGNGKLGQWSNVSFSSLVDWQYELGLDRESHTGDPRFVDPDGDDNILGFSYEPVGAVRIIDDGDAGFTTSGEWTSVTDRGHSNDILQTAQFETNPRAQWTFTGLTAGQTYELAITWPRSSGSPLYARYEIYAGQELLSVVRVDQFFSEPDDFQDSGAPWERLGVYQTVAGSLTVVLRHDEYDWGTTLVADAIRLAPVQGLGGADDNFHVPSASAAVDAGDPNSYYLREPWPNGSRANLGADGNSPRATASPEQIVQIVSPNGGEKLELGAINIDWRLAGYGAERTVALVNVGGPTVDNWGRHEFQVTSGRDATVTEAVDINGVANAAPEAVYKSSAYAPSALYVENAEPYLKYSLPAPDGSYTLRLHFAEPYAISGQRVFDIRLQDATVVEDFDIVASAGEKLRAVVQTFDVNVNDGQGLQIELRGQDPINAPILSGIELLASTPSSPASPPVELLFSPDGGLNWELIATGQTADRFGRGSYQWSGGTETDRDLVRARTLENLPRQDASDQTFVVANAGHEYYVNVPGSAEQTGKEYTTAPGNYANSGKTKSAPMASLSALLNVYDLDPGDTIYVDTGVYHLPVNIALRNDDSGVVIQGPTIPGTAAVLNRGNTADGSYGLEFFDADGVTISYLDVTGGQTGLYVANASDADDLTVSNCEFYGNTVAGIAIFPEESWQSAINSRVLIERNTARDNGTGIKAVGGSITIRHNDVFGNDTGIAASVSQIFVATESQWVTVADNTIHDNWDGLHLSGGEAVGNSVSGHTNGRGIYVLGGDVRDNIVFANGWGISGRGNVVGNRVFDNDWGGITTDGGTVQGNRVYSNPIGILGQSNWHYSGAILSNAVYANTETGILVRNPKNQARVVNNTVYQSVGDALRVEGGGETLAVRNNILWTDTGFAVAIEESSQPALDSDYNLFHQGNDPDAHVGQWGTAVADSLADWKTVSGQDSHSRAGNPLFVDIDGADNVFGFDSREDGIDGGFDDNLMLAAHSPAIDAADTWAGPGTDFFGALRSDDPASLNTGTDDYYERTVHSTIFGSAASAVFVTPVSGLSTDENGGTAQFFVVLEGRPLADVTITLSSSDPTEGTMTPPELVFTSANWNVSQTVTVTGVDDQDTDGDVNYTIVTSAASSTDPSYDDLDVADVHVTNAGRGSSVRGEVVVAGSSDLASHEDGWTMSFVVSLDRQPTSNVTIPLSSSDPTEGSVSPATLTITPDNWADTYSVVVTGVDDDLQDGPVVFTVILGACISDDPLFHGVDPRDVGVVNADNDRPDIQRLTDNETDDWFPLADGGYVGWGQAGGSGSAGEIDLMLFDGTSVQTIGQTIDVPWIDEGRIAWTGGPWTDPQAYLYDGQQVRSLGDGYDPCVDGQFVVWSRDLEGRTEIYFYDGTSSRSIGSGENPRLSGRQVAWIGPRDLALPDAGSSVYFFDGTDTWRLSNTAAEEPVDLPQLDAGRIVWTGGGEGSTAIYFFDGIVQGTPRVQRLGAGARPHLDAGRVAWSEGAASHLMLFDGSATRDLSATPVTEFDLQGNVLAWTANAAVPSGVYLYDGTTTQHLGSGRFPQIDNGQVVWVSEDESGSSVFFYDGLTTRRLGPGSLPWLENGTVVWQSSVDMWTTAIYLYDGTGIRQLSSDGFLSTDWPQPSPGEAYGLHNDFVIDSGRVVWSSSDGHAYEIYRYAPGGMPYAPVAFPDGVYRGNSDAVVNVPAASGLLANDWAPAGSTLSAQLANPPRHGTVSVQSDGSFRYIPDPGYSGQDSFSYQVSAGVERSYTASVRIEIDAQRRIEISPTNNLRTSEDGQSATAFQIQLVGQPTHDVTISLATNDTTEGTVSPSSVTFTPENWQQPKWIMVSGVDDGVPDGDVDYLVIVSPASSLDPQFNGLDAPDLSVVNGDDDVDLTRKDWRDDDGLWELDLPFDFPYYGEPVYRIGVSSNGLLQMPYSSWWMANNNGLNSGAELARLSLIAPLWDDLTTSGERDNIFVEEADDHVVVRWNATNKANAADAQFAAVLYQDGRVRYEYGPGNEGVSPTVGISRGDHGHWNLARHDGASSLEYAEAVEFYLAPGFTDIGAFEFLGDSNDAQPPRLVGTTPAGIHFGGIVGGFFACNIEFSEPVNVIDARAPADYDLRDAGANGIYGDADDSVFDVIPTYTIGSRLVSLGVAAGLLPPGTYQLTVSGTSSIHDQAGIRLDGDNDGHAGGDYVRTFTVLAPGIQVEPTAGLTTSEDGQTAYFNVRLVSPPTAPVSIDLTSSDPQEGVPSPAQLIFTPDNWQQSQLVTITGLDDDGYDGDAEFLIVTQPATSADAVYAGWDAPDIAITNLDNDPVPTPQLLIDDVQIDESSGVARFTVSLLVASTSVVTVQYATSDAEAIAGTDYTAASGTLTFSPGDTQKFISVTIVDDNADEANETFIVTLSHASGAPIQDGSGTGTILDDDDYRGWQNPIEPKNVNGDRHVVPMDALIIVNELNARKYITGNGRLPAERPLNASYFDVNGDGYCTTIDALIVINYLNADAGQEGEAEKAGANAPYIDAPADGPEASVGQPVQGASTTEAPLPSDVEHRGRYIATTARAEPRYLPLACSILEDDLDTHLETCLDNIAADIATAWRDLNR